MIDGSCPRGASNSEITTSRRRNKTRRRRRSPRRNYHHGQSQSVQISRASADLMAANRPTSLPTWSYITAGVFSEFAIRSFNYTRGPCRFAHEHTRLLANSPSTPGHHVQFGRAAKEQRPCAAQLETGAWKTTQHFPAGWRNGPWMTLLWLASAAHQRPPRLALPDACEAHA